jgi:hypothetical protein
VLGGNKSLKLSFLAVYMTWVRDGPGLEPAWSLRLNYLTLYAMNCSILLVQFFLCMGNKLD